MFLNISIICVLKRMSEENIKKINWDILFNDLTNLTLSGLWCGYFLKFYLEIDSDLRSSYVTTFLFIEIICSFVALGFGVLGFFVDFFSLGKEVTDKQLANDRLLNNVTLKMISQLNRELSMIACMTLVPTFIPYTQHNCHSYSKPICIFARIMAFFGIMNIIMYGIVVVFLILYLLCCCGSLNHEISHTHTTNHEPVQLTRLQSLGRQLNNTNQFTQTLISFTPLRHLKLLDVECCICLESGSDGNSDFSELPCKHTFHTTCINTWTSNLSNMQRHTCPVCRQSITTAKNLTRVNNTVPPAPNFANIV